MRFYQGKEVLVTGAGGFIGSHLTEELVKLGAKVRVFLRYNSQNRQGFIGCLPKDIRGSLDVFWGDLKDPQAVAKATSGISIVFHLGALIGIPYSYLNPLDVVQTNVVGTANILNACKDHQVEKLIHTSSSEVYGTAQYTPINEAHPLQGQSPYSATKIATDKLAESYYRSFALPVTILRPFNTYGPRQSARAIIPTIITQALTGKKVKLGSLQPTRDFTYISDTIQGFLRLGECNHAMGQTINLGSGHETSIEDLVRRISSILKKDVEIKCEPGRVRPKESEVERLVCDNSKAKQILHWEPKVALDEGLTKTIRWISKNLDHFENIGRYAV